MNIKGEIKVRVWSKKECKFLEDARHLLVPLKTEPGIIALVIFDCIMTFGIGVDASNGEIFEGDIIENQAGRRFLVEYVYKEYQYKEIEKDKPETDWHYVSSVGDEHLCKIVGNIFENNKL
jgi:hypothetical protein